MLYRILRTLTTALFSSNGQRVDTPATPMLHNRAERRAARHRK